MLAVDIIGLTITICLVGIKYPHYVLAAAVIHEFSRVIMALFLHGQIQSVVAAGVFGSIVVDDLSNSTAMAVIMFCGPLANYVVSATVGGIEFESTAKLINPFAAVKHPFAVVNLRLALLSFIINLWYFMWK